MKILFCRYFAAKSVFLGEIMGSDYQGTFKVSEVVNAIIAAGNKYGLAFTPLQVVKLAYIAHGWWLVFTNQPLIADNVEAWKYGPVFPSVYRLVKPYGRNEIPQETRFTGIRNERGLTISEDAKGLIKQVVKKYGRLNGIELSNLTHKEGTPWQKFYKQKMWNVEIPNDEIRSHFIELRNRG